MFKIEDDYMQIFNSMAGLLIIDTQERILFFSELLAKQTGYTQEAVIGKKLRTIIPTNNTYKVLKTGEPNIAELYFVQGNTIVSNGIPIYKNGELVGAFEYDTFSDAANLHSFLDHINSIPVKTNIFKTNIRQLGGSRYTIENIIGVSDIVKKMKEEIRHAASSNSTVLIYGETGCGKELIAHSIHHLSTRGLNYFIKINCAEIPNELFESELFGYEEGTFTGAKKGGKRGKAELAHKGTLFLDEINQLALNLQPKLLRFLQEGEIGRVGGDFSIPVDVRIIVTTNQDLYELVQQGWFREDLYYRLNVIRIGALPLRYHKEDIPLILKEIINRLNNTLGRVVIPVKHVSPEVYPLLENYDWPGNVRELNNIVERAMNVCFGDCLEIKHFEDFIRMQFMSKRNRKEPILTPLSVVKKEAERKIIRKALKLYEGNKTKAAKALGISRQMFHRKCKTLLIE